MSDDDVMGMFSFFEHLGTLTLLRDAGGRVMVCLALRWHLTKTLDRLLGTEVLS